MAFDFTGKLVLVTGGSAGIGAEISKGIVAGGGHVIVLLSSRGHWPQVCRGARRG